MTSPPGRRDVDAVVVVSFGGPEGPDDVLPFLEHVLAGRNVPRARLEAVAEHYHRFGGISPINAHNRALAAALRTELAERGPDLAVYWGNRHWHPFLADTIRAMADDGVGHALAFVTSAYASWSGCRQYRDDISRAQDALGDRAPAIDKLRLFFDHPGFVEPFAEALGAARGDAGTDAPVLFSAHSIPMTMAATCDYVAQLTATAGLVAERAGRPAPAWQLVFQSRSGPPDQPWLAPDVGDAITELAGHHDAVIVAPIGFVSDHMEVVYDLDVVARAAADRAGVRMVRAATPGAHPRFVAMIRSLVDEWLAGAPRVGLTSLEPTPGRCRRGCCPLPGRQLPGAMRRIVR